MHSQPRQSRAERAAPIVIIGCGGFLFLLAILPISLAYEGKIAVACFGITFMLCGSVIGLLNTVAPPRHAAPGSTRLRGSITRPSNRRHK
jgi:hypothetical protein